MGTDHKGRRIGDNHKATPRISQMLAYKMGYDPKFLGGAIPEEYREETAQNLIDSHRAGVGRGRGGSNATPLISDVVKNRHGIVDGIAEERYQRAWNVTSPREEWGNDDGRNSYLFDHPDDPPRGY
jgi:hypothetical protein